MAKAPRLLAATAIAVAALLWNGETEPSTPADLIAPAQAVIGRPLTPVSYAGVARRTTRRAVVATAAVTPPPTTVVVEQPATTCTEVTSPDGTVTKTCN